jgi:hypothetical protein
VNLDYFEIFDGYAITAHAAGHAHSFEHALDTTRTDIDKYLSNYTELRSAALLKRARALEGLKKDADQKATLEALLKEFPDSAEAATAQQMLKDLEPEPKKPAPKGAKKAP